MGRNFTPARTAVRIAISILALSRVSAAWGNEVSGTYVGKGRKSAYLLQVVSLGSSLTGRLEEVTLEDNGHLKDLNANVSGVSDPPTIILTITPIGFLSGSIVASGTVDGTSLHITGGGDRGSISLQFEKSDESQFRSAVALLSQEGQQTSEAQAEQRQAKRNAEGLSSIRQLISKIDQFKSDAYTTASSLDRVEEQYRSVTGRMRAKLSDEQSIYGGWQLVPQRGKISNSILEIHQTTYSIHNDVERIRISINFRLAKLNDLAKPAQGACKAEEAAVSLSSDWKDACGRLFKSASATRDQLNTLYGLFEHLETVYRTEERDQQIITQAAGQAINGNN